MSKLLKNVVVLILRGEDRLTYGLFSYGIAVSEIILCIGYLWK